MRRTSLTSPKVTLALLAGVSLAPLILALLLTNQRVDWHPQKFINHGEFITPPQNLVLTNIYEQDKPITNDIFIGKWSLISMSPGSCDEPCRYALTTMRNALLALGKNVLRTQRLVFTETASVNHYHLSQVEDAPTARVLHTDHDLFQSLLGQLNALNIPDLHDARRLYLVDPQGRLIMSFAPNTPFVDLVADVKRLLAASSKA